MRINAYSYRLILAASLALAVFPAAVSAGAMAVSIDDLYLYNNNHSATNVEIANLPAGANRFSVAAHGVCKVDHAILFQPFAAESNNFVIMLTNDGRQNPIVIDQFGLLSLAADSALKLASTGKVQGYSLLGFCGNHLGQYKFLNVETHANSDRAPNFNLANCSLTSNYVYFINDNYVKVSQRLKKLNFAKISTCKPAADGQN